jgi:VWFA-related protein
LLLPLSALAQNGGTPTENTEEPVIRAGTEEVMLDVVVRDKHGRRVTDLQPGDLEIFDNGVRRIVQSFQLVEVGQGSAGAASPARQAPAEKPKELNPLDQVRLVTLIFNRLDLNGRHLAHTAAAALVKNEFPENVYMSVFVLGDRLQALQPFTNDRALLRTAVDHATSGSDTEFVSDSSRIEEQMKRMLGPPTAGGSVGEQVQAADNAAGAMARLMLNMLQTAERSELAQLGRSSIWGLMSSVEGQTNLPGRKSILLFSSGFGVPQGMEESWRTLISTANRFNVTFYAIDARGLDTSRANEQAVAQLNDAASASRASAMTGAGTVTPAMANSVDTAMNAGKNGGQDTLADLAQSTGGFLISNSNDFREGLRKVSEDIESYYEVTYNPQIASYDGSYRKIEVRSPRAGLRIQSRAGYFALPVSAASGPILAPYEVPLMQALHAGPLPHPFDFESAGMHFRGAHGESACSLVLDIPLANVTLRQAAAQGAFVGDVAYVAIIKNLKGDVVEKFRGDVPLAATAAQVPALKNSHFIFARSLALAAGQYTLEAAAVDRTDSRIGARKSAFLVPESQPEIEMSSVALVRGIRDKSETTPPDDPFEMGGKVITPSLSPVSRADRRELRFYMVIYPDKNIRKKPELVMKFSRDGVEVGGGSPALPEPDSSGRIQYVVAASPDKMEPGNYEVRFLVMQGAETDWETVTFTLN